MLVDSFLCSPWSRPLYGMLRRRAFTGSEVKYFTPTHLKFYEIRKACDFQAARYCKCITSLNLKWSSIWMSFQVLS